MKGAILATAAALLGSALADGVHMRRHGHDAIHQRRALQQTGVSEPTCGCTTKVITYYGSPTLVPISSTPTPTPTPITSKLTTTLSSTSYSTVTVVVTPASSSSVSSSSVAPSAAAIGASSSETPVASPSTSSVALPTGGVSTFPSTGVFTIPATTLTVTEETTVAGATTTAVPSGTNTIGGVTTVVETSTTIVCPYATVSPSGTTVTSVIKTTTYVCPSAGTYTIAPITTYVSSSTVLVYPTPATVTPGTYTQPEQTVTVTETDYTYYCPFATSSGLPTSSSAAPVVPTTAAAQPTTAAAQPTTAAAQPTSAAPSVASSASASSASSSSAAAAPSSSNPVVTGGQQYGMTYSPYTNTGGCKAKSDVLNDIASIKQKGFSVVRIYSTDCSGLEWVGEAAAANGLKMILGVYVSSSGASAAQEQVQAIASWAQWNLVELVVVGNEAIQNGWITAGALASFIGSAKSTLQGAGYTGPVTTTEPLNIWQEDGSTLCGAVDVVGCNIHPFFNSQVTPAEAGNFVKEEFQALSATCPGKEMINLETGWPNAGEANGAAVPGASEQITAIKSLVQEVGSKSVFFSFANDDWKTPGDFAVEQHWGCADVF
jgi:exo-beta-1,3-glucanase (GH17 family)